MQKVFVVDKDCSILTNMKLSQWAKNNNYTYRGAFNVFKRGLIPNSRQLPTGTIVIDDTSKERKIEYNIFWI